METPQESISALEGAPGGGKPANTETHPLSHGQLTALQNLARKQAGEAVDWINISDAGSLTERSFADRGREGWLITAAGLAALKATVGIDDHQADASLLADHQTHSNDKARLMKETKGKSKKAGPQKQNASNPSLKLPSGVPPKAKG